jgi:energy-coupling factor transporter transmembrane protein EcfT
MDKSTKIIIVIAWVVGYVAAEAQANAEYPMCVVKSFLYYTICQDRIAFRNGVWIGSFVLIFLILIIARWFYRNARENATKTNEKSFNEKRSDSNEYPGRPSSFCAKCGEKVLSEDSFCPECGNKINKR